MTDTKTPRSIAVRCIAFYQDKLLVLRHIGHISGQTTAYWATPGGRLEQNESLIACFEREMIEETAIKPKIGKLLFIQQFLNDNGTEKMEFFFKIDNPEDYQNIDLSKTSHGLIEIAEIGFRDIDQVDLKPSFLTKENIRQQIETDQPVKLFDFLK